MIENIAAQIIGALGYTTMVGAGFNKNRATLLCIEVFGCALIAAQWFMLGAPSLAIAQLIFAYATVTGTFAERHKIFQYFSLCSLPLMALFIFAFTDVSLVRAFCVLGACIFGLSAKSRTNLIHLRGLSICGSCCWFMLNIYSGSIAGVMCNIGYITVHARGLIKLFNTENALPVIPQPNFSTLK